MKNNKKIMLSLAMVAIIVVAAVGIGYAYQASTQNSGNSVAPGYMQVTLTNTGGTAAYSDIFDGNVLYDTVVTEELSAEKITYTLTPGQLTAMSDKKKYSDGTAASDIKAKQIGNTLRLNISETGTNANENFYVEMTNVLGSMSANYTYYIGFKYADTIDHLSTADEYVIPYTIGGSNLIKPYNGDKFNVDIKYINVNLYVTGMTPQKLDLGSNPVAPLNEVTFKFTASTGDIVGHRLILDYNSADGTITAETGKYLTQTFYSGDTIELTFAGVGGKTNIAVTVDGVARALENNKCTITFASADIVVAATFTTPTQ